MKNIMPGKNIDGILAKLLAPVVFPILPIWSIIPLTISQRRIPAFSVLGSK